MNHRLQELLSYSESSNPESDKLQHVLIGTPERIREATHTLEALRYADVSLWSAIVPMPGSNLSMSVLTRSRSRSN